MAFELKLEDRLVDTTPTPQNAIDIFKGQWVSKLPEGYISGSLPLFEDPRIPDALKELGPVKGKRVLDLGPLEGGQAYVLEKLGAKAVTSIEANAAHYLKCLVAKEVLGMKTKFLLGDVVEFLKNTNQHFDLCVASGILYHMLDPIELLCLLVKIPKLIIWTHYYDETETQRNKINMPGGPVRELEGKRYQYYTSVYAQGFDANTFCGGTADHSHWMTKIGILDILGDLGYTVKVLQDGDSINGPFLLLTASR